MRTASILLGTLFILAVSAGTWYFSLTREGKPLVQPYNIFSDCFATQAFGQLYKATGEQRYADIAVSTFNSILERRNNPKRQWSKAVGETRPLKNFALPMIYAIFRLKSSICSPPQ